jgi:hypothetical protein
MKGSFSGMLLDSGVVAPAAALAATAAVSNAIVATLTLTADTGNTFAFKALISRVGVGVLYAQGQAASVSYNFTSCGAITQVWS